jgi:hypothetical protein
LTATGPASGLIGLYFRQLRLLASRPVEFYDTVFFGFPPLTGRLFARLNGLLLAALFFVIEALSSGRVGWPLLLAAGLSIAALPFLMEGAAALWAFFLVLTDRMLKEGVEPGRARAVSEYSTAGLLPLAFGNGWVSLLALSVVVFQVAGLQKALGCSRFRASVLVGFPFALLLTLSFLVTIIFKTKVF